MPVAPLTARPLTDAARNIPLSARATRVTSALYAGRDVGLQKGVGERTVDEVLKHVEANRLSARDIDLADAFNASVVPAKAGERPERLDVLVLTGVDADGTELLKSILASRDGKHVLSAPGATPIALHPGLRIVAVSQGNDRAHADLAQVPGLEQIQSP